MTRPTLFAAGATRCVELGRDDLASLQRFFEANPGYFVTVYGRPAPPNEARDEFEFQLPPAWPHERKWLIGFVQGDGTLIGMADVVSNLFARGIWHIGLFMVAAPLQGHGVGRAIYEALEAWMREQGATWLRLGVVEGNDRAERFWEKAGYVEVRRRFDLEMGSKVNDLRVMAKPLAGGTLAEYLGMVARDRPDAG